MCVFLFNGAGGALFDVFFFSPAVLPLPPRPIGTGLSDQLHRRLLVFRFLHRTGNTQGVKRPVCSALAPLRCHCETQPLHLL
jgi:hypothetical protein